MGKPALIPVPRYRKWSWHYCSFCGGRIAETRRKAWPDGSVERTAICLACGSAETFRVW